MIKSVFVFRDMEKLPGAASQPRFFVGVPKYTGLQEDNATRTAIWVRHMNVPAFREGRVSVREKGARISTPLSMAIAQVEEQPELPSWKVR
jgi:hypothetical protein